MKILILVALLGFAWAKVDYTGHQVYRIHPRGYQHEVVKKLHGHYDLDFWSEAKFDGDFVDFRVPPHLKPQIDVLLARNRISYELFIADIQLAIDAQVTPGRAAADSFDFAVYHTFDEIDNWIDSFSAGSPLVEAVSVGNGLSYEKRGIRALKISTGSGIDSSFVINCGIHAREWVSPASCIWIANELVTQYNVDPEVTGILNNMDIYIIPVANPDGYSYTSTDRMWRKTRSPRTNDNNCLTNAGKSCFGVDPNRNFDIMWSQSGGASPECCNDAYRGPSAFSEVETIAQRDFVEGLGNVKSYIDIHSYSQLWMFPYGFTTSLPDNYLDLKRMGDDSVAAIEAVHGKVYTTGTIANTIYVATGSTADYFYEHSNVKCTWAGELRDKGRYGFLLPDSQIIPTAQETLAGLKVLAKGVIDEKCG